MVVERYRNMVGGSGMPDARAGSYVDAASAGVGVAEAIAGAGEGMRAFAQVTWQRREERDMDIVERAMNQYNLGMMQYLDDPQKGVLWDPKYRKPYGKRRAMLVRKQRCRVFPQH